MSKIIPFPALIPAEEFAGPMLSPPYDVVDTATARKLASGKPQSLLHITRPEIDMDREVEVYDDEVFRVAKKNLADFETKGWLIRDEPSLYAYRLIRGDHVQTGLVCGASVAEYDDGRIRKHEKTRPGKEDERTELALAIRAHLEPVLYVHKKNEAISKIMNAETENAPLYDLTDHEGVRHTLWRIANAKALIGEFEGLDSLYIADGHHRSAAAARVCHELRQKNPDHKGSEAYNFFPVVIFPEDEVLIYQYDWEGENDLRPIASVTMTDIIETSDRGEIMPPKSTWFAPKLASGLFVYTL